MSLAFLVDRVYCFLLLCAEDACPATGMLTRDIVQELSKCLGFFKGLLFRSFSKPGRTGEPPWKQNCKCLLYFVSYA